MGDESASRSPVPRGTRRVSNDESVTAEIDLDRLTLLDPEVSDCPYAAYDALRREAPVWRDNATGMYVVTRYEDVRQVLTDTVRFTSARHRGRIDPRSARLKKIYEEKGWLPGATLAARDDPEHREMRGLFNHAFRPSKIKEMDDFIVGLAHRLIDDFIAAGRCDWVRSFAIPLPLIVIGRQMGARDEDMWRIKAWTDAWVHRLGMMQTEDEAVWSTEMEIEAQHYFQPIFERLRREPDDTLLSDLVNTVIPEWGRTLTDNELHAEMMADTFVGGSETTTNALAEGVRLLIENPAEWDKLVSDPDHYVPLLAEEVLRLEGPVQGLFRTAAVDVELHGVTIPAGSVVNVRYGAANRDETHFECPEKMDLDRDNVRSHVAFGFGTHHCLGAPLARRELIIGFRALVDRIDRMWFIEGANDFRHHPNFCLRALKHLHIGFTAR
ncbi:MAG: cytochrome P450 [Actinobacteria bacterium]|nr:cytochrome P450 [Actinomycetota bacterium]